MKRSAYILATAGHVDHGKSALVRALTGTDPDRLPEEKLRGMTIELGFAHLMLESDGDEEFDVGVVDVPGHEDFVRNMVAGVGSVDAALLVVAADDGWMPQTEEHLQILVYLGVRHGVVALTKCDLAVDVNAAERGVRERLRGTAFSEAAIVRTSVKDGRGLDELRRALREMFSLFAPARDVSKPRLAVDRAFTLKGIGTVVTGTLTGGSFRRGDEVVVQPGGAATRIRTMQSHGREVEAACPGTRVALNLPDVVPGGGGHREGLVGRGDVVTRPDVGSPVRTMDVLLERSARAGPVRLRSGATGRIHHGSASIPGGVRLLDATELRGGGRSLARVTLRVPMLALVGDRFVLRDWSEQHTLAGGVVLDVNPPGRRQRSAQKAMLEQRADTPRGVKQFVVSQVVRDGVRERRSVLPQSIFAEREVEEVVARACEEGALVAAGPIVAGPDAWAALLSEARAAIEGFHASHPERGGLPLAELERVVRGGAKARGVWEAVLAALEGEDFRRDATVIRRNSHRPALPPRLEPSGRQLRSVLAECGLDAPARKVIARDDLAGQALRFLIANGEVVEIGPEQVMSSEAYGKAVELVRRHIRQHGPSTVSGLKTALGSSRRVMVPLVEKLDRDGITLRQGDLRVLR
jgi:selenocysteine-specific elongation factor